MREFCIVNSYLHRCFIAHQVTSEIKSIGRNTQGVRIMRLDESDALAAVVPVPPGEAEETTEPVPGEPPVS